MLYLRDNVEKHTLNSAKTFTNSFKCSGDPAKTPAIVLESLTMLGNGKLAAPPNSPTITCIPYCKTSKWSRGCWNYFYILTPNDRHAKPKTDYWKIVTAISLTDRKIPRFKFCKVRSNTLCYLIRSIRIQASPLCDGCKQGINHYDYIFKM